MAFKNFDAGAKKVERPSFEVAGQTFTCRAKLSFRKWKNLFAGLDESSTADSMVKIDDFFAAVLLPGDRERFAELLNADEDDDESVVTLQSVNEIVQWLMEHYAGNPSEQPST